MPQKLPFFYLLFTSFWLLFLMQSNAQSIAVDRIGKDKPLKINGAISTNHILYLSSGDNRRSPYNYFLSGNLNFSLYGFAIPLSFSYSNQNFSYQQPFNQFSLQPTYKGFTAHIGNANMTFSPYTLAGHNFAGAGLEYQPQNNTPISFSVMLGRLQKAVAFDTTQTPTGTNYNTNLAAYKRMGTGAKIAYKKNKNSIEASVFRGWDEENSIIISRKIADSIQVKPQENLAFSISGTTTIFKKISLKAEYGASALTTDTRLEGEGNGKSNLFTTLGFKNGSSTSFHNAFKSNIDYQHALFTIGVGFERISPNYKTLGAYFFNNDMQNITTNVATRFFKQKLNISGNFGVQTTNLSQQKVSSSERLVGAVNMSMQVSKKLNTSLNYSNFTTFTNIRSQFREVNALTPYENLDTLNYRQISQNIGANLAYNIKQSKEKTSSIQGSLTYQTSADQAGRGDLKSGGSFYNFNTGYSYGLPKKNLTLSFSTTASSNSIGNTNSFTIGPNLNITKAFFDKKLKTNMGIGYNTSKNETTWQSQVYNVRFGAGYVIDKKHNFNLSNAFMYRKIPTKTSVAELTLNFTYSYSFSVLGDKKPKTETQK